jgi:hypothetical protein
MGRCKMAKADEAFAWMLFVMSAACLAMSFMVARKGGTSRYVV